MTGDTKLGPTSLPNYLSHIRLAPAALGLGKLLATGDSLRLQSVCTGYAKAADKRIPPTTLRASIPAHVLYSTFGWAARPRVTRRDLRDAALVVSAAVFGLRAKKAKSILYEQTEQDAEIFLVVVGSLKRCTFQGESRRSGRSFYSPSDSDGFPQTVLELNQKWT